MGAVCVLPRILFTSQRNWCAYARQFVSVSLVPVGNKSVSLVASSRHVDAVLFSLFQMAPKRGTGYGGLLSPFESCCHVIILS